MTFKLGDRSISRLTGVHPDLVRVVKRAIELTEYDFGVGEGVRLIGRQAELFAAGKSQTMRSRHLATVPPKHRELGPVGHAVDLIPSGNPIPWDRCGSVSAAMFAAAAELGIPIRWGGDWDMDGDSCDESFYDGPHFELLRSAYP